MSDAGEVEAWTQILGVSPEELARAVEAEGNNALNLREHFVLRRSSRGLSLGGDVSRSSL